MTKYSEDMQVFSAMQTGEPIAAYRKTILGKVYVSVLNVFSGEPEIVELYGKPGTDTSIIKVWSIPEDVFFKRMNKRFFSQGMIIAHDLQKVSEPQPATMEQSSDEDLRKLVNSKFLSLNNVLNKTNSEALLLRLIGIAREEEKSEKIINAIEARLAEVQQVQIKVSEE